MADYNNKQTVHVTLRRPGKIRCDLLAICRDEPLNQHQYRHCSPKPTANVVRHEEADCTASNAALAQYGGTVNTVTPTNNDLTATFFRLDLSSSSYSSSSTSSNDTSEIIISEPTMLSRNASVPMCEDRPNYNNWRGRRYSLVQALSNPLTRLLDEPSEFNAINGTLAKGSTLNYSHNNHVSTTVDAPRRLAILNEMVNCEKEYVNLLVTLVEEFMKPARFRRDLFDSNLITAVFCNIDKLTQTHQSFLADLEFSLTRKPVCVGPTFLKHSCSFDIYSLYCNNHQRSCQRLMRLYAKESHAEFFEECRSAGRLPFLRLDSFLLRPVQHLCRYPLLLAELLRITPKFHPDYNHCSAALEFMQILLRSINNKRKMLEEMVELVRWQKSLIGWHGPDILHTSSRLLHSGELSCSCLTKTGLQRWNKRSMVFLFDHLIVICRKDRLKNKLMVKNRISTEHIMLEKSDTDSWELNVPAENKRYVFKASSRPVFLAWMDALDKENLSKITLSRPSQFEIELAEDSVD